MRPILAALYVCLEAQCEALLLKCRDGVTTLFRTEDDEEQVTLYNYRYKHKLL